MAEESWREARLIPTSGINGAEEQERRATSALLAVMSAVHEFGRAITRPLGAPAGSVDTYIEVPFQVGERKLYPDGLVRVARGKRSWTALVEVKTGKNALAAEQLNNYLDIAREHSFDAVITISNEIPPVVGQHPTAVDRRKTRKVALHHLAWSQVLNEAVLQKEFRGVADPDQAWILGELIRYLEHPRSGALEFDDMGDAWTNVRDAVGAGTLRSTDKGIAEVVARFDGLVRFLSLRLGRQLGAEVTPVLSKRETADPTIRSQRLADGLVREGELTAQLKVPGALAPLAISADLRAGKVTCFFDIDAPDTGRPLTRVKWLVRQLGDAPASTRVEAFVLHGRGSSAAELLSDLRADPGLLVASLNRDLRAFRIAGSVPMGAKRGRGRGSFIDSVIDAVDSFYGQVMENVRPWSPPKLRAEPPRDLEVETGVKPSLVSTSYSSQDEAPGVRKAGATSSAGTLPQTGPVVLAARGDLATAVGIDPATPEAVQEIRSDASPVAPIEEAPRMSVPPPG